MRLRNQVAGRKARRDATVPPVTRERKIDLLVQDCKMSENFPFSVLQFMYTTRAFQEEHTTYAS